MQGRNEDEFPWYWTTTIKSSWIAHVLMLVHLKFEGQKSSIPQTSPEESKN